MKTQVAGAQEQVREVLGNSVADEKLANWLRDLKVFCADAFEHPRPCFGAEHSTSGDGVGSQGEHQVESSNGRF